MILTTKDMVKTLIPVRSADANKYSVGSLICICGSYGYAGAAILSLRAALRSGVGFVRCVLPESIYPIVSSAVPEAVFSVMTDNEKGTLKAESIKEILRLAARADAMLIGCGMGCNDDTVKIVSAVLENCSVPVLLDADGINCVSKHINILRETECDIVVTPHEKEMERLCKTPASEIRKNREQCAGAFSDQYGVVTVLKGKDTVIASENSEVFVNPTGNSGLATLGSGDVLSGITASLMAQGAEARDAAVAGVYLHGLSADICRDKLTMYSMLPSDVIDNLHLAIKECTEG